MSEPRCPNCGMLLAERDAEAHAINAAYFENLRHLFSVMFATMAASPSEARTHFANGLVLLRETRDAALAIVAET